METVVHSDVSNKKDCYQVVVGEDSINAKVKRILASAQGEVTLLLTRKGLVSFYHAEITDMLTQLSLKGVQVKLKTSCKNAHDYLNNQCITAMTLASAVPLSFILIDNKEMILLLENENASLKKDEAGFYTNSSSMARVFKFIFDNIS
jgi:hypothetical protein